LPATHHTVRSCVDHDVRASTSSIIALRSRELSASPLQLMSLQYSTTDVTTSRHQPGPVALEQNVPCVLEAEIQIDGEDWKPLIYSKSDA
jgi:hypothetical protein